MPDVRQIIEALGTKATEAATGAVSNAKYFMAYIKQIVTLAIAIKERTDLIPDDPADQSEIIAEIDENEVKLDSILSEILGPGGSWTDMQGESINSLNLALQYLAGVIGMNAANTFTPVVGGVARTTLEKVYSALDVILQIIDANIDWIKEASGNDNWGFGALRNHILTNKALIETVDANVDWVKEAAGNDDHGFGALKVLLNALQTDLDNGTDGLGALKALIDTIDGIVDDILVDTATLEHIDFGDCVYFYSGSGAGGTAYPLGTPTNPVNSMANAKTIADALNIHCIRIHGAATIPSQMEHYTFLGHRHEALTDYIDLNGQDVDGCYFEGLLVKGSQVGAGFINIKDCIVYTLTNFTGMITNSAFYYSTCSLENGAYADIDSCYSIYGAVTLTVRAPTRASIKDWKGNLILTAQNGGVMFLRGFIGTLQIDAMTSGTLSVYAEGADITINADCSGGTINLYGNAQVTGAGGGVTINNYTLPAEHDTLAGLIIAMGG